jgi:hypothetical protein
MNLRAYKQSFFSRKTLEVFGIAFFSILGFLALILGILDIFYPDTLNLGNNGLITIVLISMLGAVLKTWPKLLVSRVFSVPNVEIVIKEGDLFEASGNIVIGMSDTFDTEKGKIIKPSTVQGQFLTRTYNDDLNRLDSDLDSALATFEFTVDNDKNKGKQNRYPIGTTAILEAESKRYFCIAYSVMNNDFHAQSSIKMLSSCLDSLWSSVRTNGQNEGVSMAIIGSDTARVSHIASHTDLIKLIVLSFILTSREKIVTPSLTLYIHSKDREKINMLEIQGFLQSF